MDAGSIQKALSEIAGETDPVLKALRMASLCSEVCRKEGIELAVVGGSAIELFTEGAYLSADLDLCLVKPASLSLRKRQEIMATLGAKGGPRSWETAGMFIDLLGEIETLARTPLRKLEGPYGIIQLVQPEELLVERVLVSVYPRPYPPARDCVEKLAAVALGGALQMDWKEVARLAALPEYRILRECKALVGKLARELEVKNPFHPDK